MRVGDEIRVGSNDFVAGIDDGQECGEQPAAGAAGDEHVALGVVEMGEAGLRIGQESVAQLRDALSDGVAVATGVDRRLGGGLDRLGNFEVRLADAQIDRVLQRLAELEDPANTGQLDEPRPLGE